MPTRLHCRCTPVPAPHAHRQAKTAELEQLLAGGVTADSEEAQRLRNTERAAGEGRRSGRAEAGDAQG